ncbi:MAG: cytochrome B [Ancylobacter novellus]|uniref:Cytochrome B n=1 Tax=Ancylobacter novellus TaxID=921 RepID=A0A2W5KC14_ANCNO|nr:MAG: cytochrome B [Ancylobacter novellus]
MKSVYEWSLRMARHRHAERALAVACFAESSFIPMFPEVMLLPMILAERAKAWRYAAVCTISSVIGGIVGYLIGYLLFEAVGEPLMRFYGMSGDFEQIAGKYNEYGWLMVLIGGGITPIPYKIITIASGVTQLDFLTFVAASVVARGVRFALPCGIIYFFGEHAKRFMETRAKTAFWIALALMIVGFAGAPYLFGD